MVACRVISLPSFAVRKRGLKRNEYLESSFELRWSAFATIHRNASFFSHASNSAWVVIDSTSAYLASMASFTASAASSADFWVSLSRFGWGLNLRSSSRFTMNPSLWWGLCMGIPFR